MEREPIDWTPRLSSRRRASLVGMARRVDGPPFRILVTNLSYEGCEVVAEDSLIVGETLTLQIPGQGNIEAQVRWADYGKGGIRFLLGGSAAEDRRARIGV